MTVESDDLKMLISKFSTMDIEELKVNIDHLEKDIDNSNQLQILDFVRRSICSCLSLSLRSSTFFATSIIRS